jgi:hypothetical protein
MWHSVFGGFIDTSTKVVFRISLFLNFVKRLLFQESTKIRKLGLFLSWCEIDGEVWSSSFSHWTSTLSLTPHLSKATNPASEMFSVWNADWRTNSFYENSEKVIKVMVRGYEKIRPLKKMLKWQESIEMNQTAEMMTVWTGFVWPWTGAIGRLFCTQLWIFGFGKMLEIF